MSEELYSMVRTPYVGDSDYIYTAECGGCPYKTTGKHDHVSARKAILDHLKDKHGIVLR